MKRPSAAIVNVTDAYPEARLIRADEIREGDIVHDVYGGEHTIVRVVTFKHQTRVVRDDQPQWPDLWPNDKLIAIVRPTGWGDRCAPCADGEHDDDRTGQNCPCCGEHVDPSPFTVEGAAIATAFEDSVQIEHLTSDQLDEVDSILTKAGY